jgi:hypothetical protein
MNRLLNPIFAALLGSVLATPALAMDPACQPVADANAKMLATPTHITSSTTAAYAGGKPRNTEMFYAGNAIYVKLRGKMGSHQDDAPGHAEDGAGGSRKQERDLPLCTRRIREWRSGALYAEQSNTEVGKSEAQTWISKSRGVPLRTEMDIDVGASMGKSHMSMRYDYANVQPPTGVR